MITFKKSIRHHPMSQKVPAYVLNKTRNVENINPVVKSSHWFSAVEIATAR